MIPGLGAIAPNHVGFAAISCALLLIAWSRYKSWFPPALAAGGVFMTMSWLTLGDLAALVAFLAVPYIATRWVWGNERARSGLHLAATVCWQILLFLVLKRYEWVDILGALGHPVAVIGLSYILFRQIHLLVEAPYLGHHELGVIRYVGFVLSPWTLIAGPIQRYDSFCVGLESVGRPERRAALADMHRVVNGCFKAFLIAPVFLAPSKVTSLTVTDADWLDALIVFYSYPVYLYLNFSGYVDIMIGTARLAGFTTLPENFNRPYLARNVQDFWTRWHISFAVWIRHYLFTPVSTGLIRRWPESLHGLAMALSVLITFFVVGMWHGNTLNFVLFGLFQGLGVIVVGMYGRWLRSSLGREGRKAYDNNSAIRGIAIVLCFHFTCATFLLLNNTPNEIVYGLEQFLS